MAAQSKKSGAPHESIWKALLVGFSCASIAVTTLLALQNHDSEAKAPVSIKEHAPINSSDVVNNHPSQVVHQPSAPLAPSPRIINDIAEEELSQATS